MYYPLVDLLTLAFFLGVLVWRFLFVRGRALHPALVFTLVFLLAASLAAPAILHDIRAVHLRLPAILAAVLVAAIDWRPVTLKQWTAIGTAFVFVLALRTGSITAYWKQHEAEVAELRAQFPRLERGAVVLPVVNEQADTGEFHWFSLAYAVLDRHIFMPSLYPDIHMLSVKPSFARLTELVATPVNMSELPPPSDPPQAGPDRYWRTWWKDFSHVLLLSRQRVDPPFASHLELVGEGSFFRLYRIKRR